MNIEEKHAFEKDVTAFKKDEFIATFGGIFEDSPWIAEAVWEAGITAADNNIAYMHERLCGVLRAAAPAQQEALICAHPELAAPAYRKKNVGQDSAREQKGAGLNNVDEKESAELASMNREYREKFGFPFIIAVAGKDKDHILAALKTRLCCERQEEIENAKREICAIALYRLRRL